MTNKLNVEQTPFDIDIFHQILAAMDGYYVLPEFRGESGNRQRLDPWDLPGMPDIGEQAWRYHVGFAVDRGYIECWTPGQSSTQIEPFGGVGFTETKYDLDPNVSSVLRPARLTYAGKEFVDNYNNPEVRNKAVATLKEQGLPFALRLIGEAARNGLFG